MQAGTWIGSQPGGAEIQGVLGAEVPLSKGIAAIAWVGAQRRFDGGIDPRDAVIGASFVLVSRDDFVVRIQPGVNLPTGGIGSGLYFTPLSTASVDPYLTGDVVYGSTWLVGLSAVTRVSLYDGWDRLRQGPFFRADLRGARRIGPTVPWVGVSAVRLFASDPPGAAPDLSELAGTVGSVANLSERWSLTGQLRLPFLVSDEGVRQLAGGLSARVIIGAGEKEEEHSDDDGHDH